MQESKGNGTVDWKAHRADHGTQHRATQKVVDHDCPVRVAKREPFAQWASQSKKKHVGRSIPK
jgi:hypothetical protein